MNLPIPIVADFQAITSAHADVGIAIGSCTDVATETADIILVNSDPKDVASLIQFGRATYHKMIQNLVWATAYNAITLPLATGFVPGIVISPAIGVVFMSVSTIIVAIMLRRCGLKSDFS